MGDPIVFQAGMEAFADLGERGQVERLLAYAPRNVALFKEQFNAVNDKDVPQRQSFEALEAAYRDRLLACEAAVIFAREHGLLEKLAQRIALASGPERQERIHGFGSKGAIAIAEGVFDVYNGLAGTRVLFALCEVNRAICLVLDGMRAVGTGILVDNDLVLTAAHVFEDAGYAADGSNDADLGGRIAFEFYAPEGSLIQSARLGRKWKVSYAPSCIARSVDGQIPPDAARCLDYMLVRLDAAVTANIAPLSLANIGRVPPDQLSERELSRRYYVMGYPGGSDAKFSFGTVMSVDPASARILHKCDTTNGMSGSPLLDDSARIVALHEGRIVDRKGELLHNRATILRSISAAIEAARLQAVPAQVFIDSAGVRRQWAEYGASTRIPALRQGWKQALLAAGVGERGQCLDGAPDHYYPIFHFRELQDWLDRPLGGDGASRVLCVEGESGSGKSFALQYAAIRYGGDGTYLVKAAIASGSSLPEMLASLFPGGSVDDATRPAEGRLRRHAENVLGYFENLAAQSSSGHLLIAVELDPDGAYWDDTYRFWRELALLCQTRVTLRLLLCGPSAGLRNELNMHGISRILCSPVDLATVQRHCDATAEQLQMPEQSAWAQARAAELWNEDRPGTTDIRYSICDAARIVIRVRHELLQQGEADGQHG